MKLVTVKMPEIYVKGIEELVKARRYSSRSEVIRIAVRELLKRELWGTEYTVFPEPLQAPAAPAPAYRPNVLKGVGLGQPVEDDEIDGVEEIDLGVA
ncbi:MAG: ribbon-helix-helix domain-containing protein [Desulfurococcales archaeon]|nr:ribbon-helix-helix domain-containing protein [Desulfurococcales archaeon]